MSLDIRDWEELKLVLASQLDSCCRHDLDLGEHFSLRLQRLLLFNCLEQPFVQVSSFSHQLPHSFSEVLPPEAGLEPALPNLVVAISIGSAFREKAVGSAQLALSVNSPVRNFAEMDCEVAITRFAFSGELLIAFCNGYVLAGISRLDLFDFDVCLSVGDPKSRQICPSQLERFISDKARQAIELLRVRPLLVVRPAGVGP